MSEKDIKNGKSVVTTERKSIFQLEKRFSDKTFRRNFLNAVDMIYRCKGKLIITGIGKSGIIAQKMDAFAGQNKFAVNFSDFKLPGLAAGVIPAAAYSGTIDRTTVDSATSRIIGSSKVASPVSGAAGPSSVTAQIDSLKQQIDTDLATLKDKAEAATTITEGNTAKIFSNQIYINWTTVSRKIIDSAFASGNLSVAQKEIEDLQTYIRGATVKENAYIREMIAKIKQLVKAESESAAAQNAAAAPSATDTSQQA